MQTTTSTKPIRRNGESLLDYTARFNKWKKGQLEKERNKKNEDVKRHYNIRKTT